jgi:hypothetical protein
MGCPQEILVAFLTKLKPRFLLHQLPIFRMVDVDRCSRRTVCVDAPPVSGSVMGPIVLVVTTMEVYPEGALSDRHYKTLSTRDLKFSIGDSDFRAIGFASNY